MTVQESKIEVTKIVGVVDCVTAGVTITVEGKREYYLSYNNGGRFSVYMKSAYPGLRAGKHFHDGPYKLNFSDIRKTYKRDGVLLEEYLGKLQEATKAGK